VVDAHHVGCPVEEGLPVWATVRRLELSARSTCPTGAIRGYDARMECPVCGNQDHPPGAHFCLRCGAKLDALPPSTREEPAFPGLFDLRCWREGRERRQHQGFGLCFSVRPAPRTELAVSGQLEIDIHDQSTGATLSHVEVPVREVDFARWRLPLLTIAYEALCWVYRHPLPILPVSVGDGHTITLRLLAEDGAQLAATMVTRFTDPAPQPAPPPRLPA
jgi:hypothetical protein